MRFFDLQLKQVRQSREGSLMSFVGYFTGTYLVLRRTFTKREVFLRQFFISLLKGFVILLIVCATLLTTILTFEIFNSGYTLFAYFISFAEHKPIIGALYSFLFLLILILVLICFYIIRKSRKTIRISSSISTEDPCDVIIDELSPRDSLDLYSVLTPQSKRTIECAVECAYFWNQSSVDHIHILKCLTLTSKHIQHIFMRIGLSYEEFISYTHDNLSQRESEVGDFDNSFISATLARAYKIALMSFELQISPLSIFEAVIMHDAQARALFESMDVNIEDVVALIELERVHERREQYLKFGLISKKATPILFGLSQSNAVILYNEYIRSGQLVLTYTHDISNQDISVLYGYLARISNKRSSIAVFHTSNILQKHGVIGSFLQLKNVIKKTLRSHAMLQVNEAQLLITSYQDTEMKYSSLDLLVDAMKNKDFQCCLTVSVHSTSVLEYLELHHTTVLALEVSALHSNLYALMGCIYQIEENRGIFFTYDALAYLAVTMYETQMTQNIFQQRLNELLRSMNFNEQLDGLLITKDMITIGLSR